MTAVCMEQENILPTSSKEFEERLRRSLRKRWSGLLKSSNNGMYYVHAERRSMESPESHNQRKQRYLSHYSHKKEPVKPQTATSFTILVSSDDFDQLSLETLCSLLSSNDITAHDELEVFMAAVKWLMFDFTKRQENVVEVMKCVRFGLMAPWELVNIRRNPQNPEFVTVAAIPEVRQMIQDGCNYALYRCEFGEDENNKFWVDQLNLSVPETRNYSVSGSDRQNVSFLEFLNYLECIKNQEDLKTNQRSSTSESNKRHATDEHSANCCGDSRSIDSNSCQGDSPANVHKSSQCENPLIVNRSAQCDRPCIENKESQCDSSSFDRKVYCYDAPASEDVH